MPSITTTDLTNAKLDVDHIAEIATSIGLSSTDRLGNTKDTVSGAIYKISGIVNKGAWVTATAYVTKDIVTDSGTWYVCVVAHTSGATFAGDSASKWRVYQGVTTGDLSASSGSTLVNTIRAGAGAVSRMQESKNRDFVSVRDSSTTAVDGVTSNQADIVTAVADAYTRGVALWWPAGIYVSTANIPNFHDVEHFGNGVIKRGSDLFNVSARGSATNIFYVATTGLDTNDGLSSSSPFLTLQAAGDKIYNWKYGNCVWKVKMAAGTYTGSTTFSKAFPTPNRVEFEGASVSLGTRPTTRLNSSAGAGTGLLIQNGVFAKTSHIEAYGYSNTNSDGFNADARSDLWTYHCWATNCYEGIGTSSESKLRAQFGVIDNCTYGLSLISNVTFTVGYNGTAADPTGATGLAIKNCQTGVIAQESATGHLDYVHISGCTNVGIEGQEKARFHILGSVLSGNNINARIRNISTIYDNPTIPNTWGAATAGDRVYGSGSTEVTLYQNAASLQKGVVRDTTGRTNATASPVSNTLYTFAANQLAQRGAGFKTTIWGDVLGTSGTKVIEVKLGGVSLGTRTVLAASTDWQVEVEFVNRTATNDHSSVFKCFEPSTLTIDFKNLATIDLTASQALTVEITSNGTDTMRYWLADLDVITTV